jgi:hypothetical protein
MIIVGLTGSIGSGKTTFADYLAEQTQRSGHWESWQVVAEVANLLRASSPEHPNPDDLSAINAWLQALPSIIEKICHKQVLFEQVRLNNADLSKSPADYEKLFQYLKLVRNQPELQSAEINEARKEELRSILQWLGGYLAKTCGGDIWYAEIIRRIEAQPGLQLATIGGVRFLADAACIKKAGGLIAAIARPGLQARDTNDPTERERNQIEIDVTIYNDGNLRQLGASAKKLASDMLSNNVAKEYHADLL